jgi:beta-glucanase (GH16 family)
LVSKCILSKVEPVPPASPIMHGIFVLLLTAFLMLSSGQFVLVRAQAKEIPPAKGPSNLHLDDYTLVFNQEFDRSLDVSAHGPGTTWIAHTPYGGDFGKAQFTDPTYTPSPFRIENGVLVIRAWKEPEQNKWRSGLLASVDSKGKGFSQALGYYEIRMRLPEGPGVWPAFWLNGLGSFRKPKTKVAEIDILEEYGVDSRIAHQHVHVWNPDGTQSSDASHSSTNQGMTTDFHTYGALIKKDYIHFYFDGVEQWKTPTPPEAREPLYVMVDLALGGGWPIDKTPNPSDLYVDYIRVYAPPIDKLSSDVDQNTGSKSVDN